MNLKRTIRRILREQINEVRVPRSERVELYKDDNIIVVVPLTHRALQKYAHKCLWCINDDRGEWKDYHQGKHAVIIQRKPKKEKIGITGQPTASEIFLLAKWDNNETSFEDVCQMLGYEFRNDRTMGDYYINVSNDINNFATNIIYYSPENGIYDMEDNFLWNFNIEINDIPNVTSEVIEIMDDYLTNSEDRDNIQESNKDKKITCDNCGWSWKLSEGGDDPYVCHKCGKDNSKKIIYPFDKIGRFVSWFNDEYGDYSNKQGWAIFDSDTELPNEKYHSIRNYKGKTLNGYYWQVQRLDSPGEEEALFGKLSNDFDADRMARKLGLMVDEFGVIYGYDGVSFLEN